MNITINKIVCDVCGTYIQKNQGPINQDIKIRDNNLCLRCGGIMLDGIIKDKVEISDEMISSIKQYYDSNKNIVYC